MKLSSATANKGKWELPAEELIPLESILNPDTIMSVLKEQDSLSVKSVLSCRKGFVRYNPGVGCIVCYHLSYVESGTNDDVQNAVFYARAFVPQDFEQAEKQTAARDWLKGSICKAPVVLRELNTILYEFPNDARLTNLALLADMEVFRESLANVLAGRLPIGDSMTCHHLRYKPENRLVARCDFSSTEENGEPAKTNSFLLRFEAKPDSRQIFELMKRMHAALEGNGLIGLPRPVFNLPDMNLQAFEWIDAVKLSELIRGPEAERWVCAAAQMLALLHRYEDQALPVYKTKDYVKRAEKARRILACAGDHIEGLSENILGQLHSLSGSTPYGLFGFVHGDFHQGQVLCDGNKSLVMDFGRASHGETVADVGNFMAQLNFMELRQRISKEAALDLLFLDTYQRSSRSVVPKNRLKYWTALGLFELAARELRRLKPGWPDMAKKLLEKCRATLDR